MKYIFSLIILLTLWNTCECQAPNGGGNNGKKGKTGMMLRSNTRDNVMVMRNNEHQTVFQRRRMRGQFPDADMTLRLNTRDRKFMMRGNNHRTMTQLRKQMMLRRHQMMMHRRMQQIQRRRLIMLQRARNRQVQQRIIRQHRLKNR